MRPHRLGNFIDKKGNVRLGPGTMKLLKFVKVKKRGIYKQSKKTSPEVFCYSEDMYEKYKRYRQRQAGEKYESFVAQTLRQEGWEVVENGINGIHDHGIDLIASKEGVRRYIQCKGWKRNKFIHEDVVSHLYGSVAAIEGPDNLLGVELYVYSPAQLDSYAGAEAEKLHIHLVRLDFPAGMLVHRYYRHFRKRSVRYPKVRI